MASGIDPYRDTNTFCVTRHPYARTISEYIWEAMMEQGCNPMREECDTQVTEAEICDPIRLNSWVQDKLSSIKEALLSIPQDGNSLPEKATYEDCHWVPQWAYNYADVAGQPMCDH